MLNKDKRSLCLSLILGDGNLHTRPDGYTLLTIDHGLAQADYQAWKAKLLSDVFDRNVRVRTGHKGKSIQLAICNNVFRAWRKFTYPSNKKDIAKILPFIRHPELAVAIWLMDDGYVEPSFSKLKDGSRVNYGARFRIFTCDQKPETQEKIISWFKETFDVTVVVRFQRNNNKNTIYPFLKINQEGSLKIWSKIREFVLQFKSMQYKFRHVEAIYQSKMAQPVPPNGDDIVGPVT